MATLMVSSADVRFGFAISGHLGRWFRGHAAPSEEEQEEARTRRDFMSEMLDRNPDAFASELDVQSMMRMFPEQF